MRLLSMVFASLVTAAGVVSAEPFKEITIGTPVSSLAEAEAWYINFLGPDTEVIKPFPGVVEFKIAPGVWLQLFEPEEQQSANTVIRFSVDDFAAAQAARRSHGIDTGEAIKIPDVVTYSEFSDPFGNALGLYALP